MPSALSETKLREWMQKAGPRLITLSASICRDRHLAEEVVQDAFVKLWRKPPAAGEAAVTSWLRRVVTNMSINALKRTRRPGPLPDSSADPALQTAHRAESSRDVDDSLERVAAAIDKLDEPKRALLAPHSYEPWSYAASAPH